jgi:hypothetical protein
MNTSSILPAPHGADAGGTPQAASALGSRFRRAGLAIWRALEASGQARALRELRLLHGHWETSDPEFARKVRDGSVFLSAPTHPHR